MILIRCNAAVFNLQQGNVLRVAPNPRRRKDEPTHRLEIVAGQRAFVMCYGDEDALFQWMDYIWDAISSTPPSPFFLVDMDESGDANDA